VVVSSIVTILVYLTFKRVAFALSLIPKPVSFCYAPLRSSQKRKGFVVNFA